MSDDTNDGSNDFPLPEGHTLLEWIVCMKVLNEEGDVMLVNQRSASLMPWEGLGMAEALLMNARYEMQDSYVEEPET